jgi:SAM-dependent MidA family methyltransferase
METALYDPAHGYYASATRRSGRGGDFYTSVDVGPLFGAVLASFFDRLWRLVLGGAGAHGRSPAHLTLVEAGAGDGRLMRDVLDALDREAPACHAAVEAVLVERSAPARARHAAVLGPQASKLTASLAALPGGIEGIVFANEILDAMPVHRLRFTAGGVEEAYVTETGGRLALRFGPPSTPALSQYVARLARRPPPGTIADVSLAASEWTRGACRALRRGVLIIVDYGGELAHLIAGDHARGTLRSYRRHQVDPTAGAEAPESPAWLLDPGQRDLTAHVDFTAVRDAAVEEGCQVLPLVDQTRFLLQAGLAERLAAAGGDDRASIRFRLAAKSLVLPGGPGSTHRVFLATRGVAITPDLLGWGG